MKILVIFSFNYSLKLWKDVGNLDRELNFFQNFNEKYNSKFVLITYGGDEDYKIIKGYEDFIEVYPIYSYLKYSDKKIVRLIHSIYFPFFINKKLNQIDIIKSIQLTGFWTGIVFRLILKKPLVVKTGYDAFIFSKLEKKPLHKKIFFYLLTQLALISCNLYTVSSDSDFKFIKKHYFSSKNLVKRQNWVKISNSKVISNQNEKKILMVGRLVEQKNYEFAFDTLKNLDFEVDIIGNGKLKKDLQSYANYLNIKVNFLGNIDNNDLLSIYKNYKYFYLPSKFEGNPKALLEAMSAGCIAIVSNIPNNLEIVQDGYNGIVIDINNTDLNFNDVLMGFQKKYNTTEVKKNAVKTIYSRFSIDTYIKSEYEDFQKLISN